MEISIRWASTSAQYHMGEMSKREYKYERVYVCNM